MTTTRTHRIASADGGSFSAYEARPDGAGPFPGVVVIQEIFGVTRRDARGLRPPRPGRGRDRGLPGPVLADRARRRHHHQSEAEWKKAFSLYNAFDVDLGIKDIAAAIAHLRSHSDCTGKVGAVGYCLGGLLAFLTAARTDADACVSYYGVGIENRLGEAGSIRNPLLVHVAEKDARTHAPS